MAFAIGRSSRFSLSFLAVMLLVASSPDAQTSNAPRSVAQTGAELYQAACETCHGPDGKGAPRSVVGFDTRLPDFSDCSFATPETTRDWAAVIHLGGPARALDRRMPAFGDALSDSEIKKIVDYLRAFCTNRAWPHGDLNLPRPLVTEKAFPENEALVTTGVALRLPDLIETRFIYERRVGPRSQYAVVVPFNVRPGVFGSSSHGLGDVAVAFKHAVFDSDTSGSIVSVGSEMTFPTGKEIEGLGRRLTVFEPFGTVSQRLPHDSFLHLNAGMEVPLNIPSAFPDVYWRASGGTSFVQAAGGRAWTPMVELLGIREVEFGARAAWDLLPEIAVSLSRRQHVLVNAGVRVPLNIRTSRSPTVMMHLLWDWSQGGLFSGW